MTKPRRKLINDPDALIEDLIEGMVSAHPQHLFVQGETGRAIVACHGPRDGKVGIVVGGGSGHEPAFAGYVGRGLADSAPLGNIFASPSPAQIMDAGFAADGGAGVLFLYGNYTGDVMNFGMAEEGLAEHDITARSFVVTDDIASAPLERKEERRGIAGDFFVFKIAGAAADLGLTMEEVEEAAKRANDATRTMGVALSACTMPQTGKANFELPAGEMEIGMGIHGEPGVERGPAGSADQVADKLLDPIIEELNLGNGNRVAVLVNGLGSTSLLELYILHRRVSEVLSNAGVDIYMSWVGEYCTSLDMEGASITIMSLDEQLTAWLDHPCDTPALRVGAAIESQGGQKRTSPARIASKGRKTVDRSQLETAGDVTPAQFRDLMMLSLTPLQDNMDHLNALDGAIGDGDHGLTMEIGWKAVCRALERAEPDATISELCDDIAKAFLDSVGASVGPLYSSAFNEAGRSVSDRLNLDTGAMVTWLEAMAHGLQKRGGATLGQKTMLDAWLPAVKAARERVDAGGTVAECLAAAADAADTGAASTMDVVSQMGRSKKLGERSRGHMDPGAASAAVLLRAWASALA